MDLQPAPLRAAALSTHSLSAALGIPVIEGAVTSSAGTVVRVAVSQLDEYRPLMQPGSLAIVDRAAGSLMVRLGPTETWLLATAEPADDCSPAAGDDALLLGQLDYGLDAPLANRVAARIAQTPGFAVVARKPQFRDEFARPLVLDWYAAEATDWHVREIAGRARNLWEFGVLPRDAKAMLAAGEAIEDIATTLGVSRSRAKWAVELPEAHSMAGYL